MELTPLRAFREVCRLGSISAAAEHLGYTQSAVSRQLAGLETQLGRSLVRRHARGVVPTAAGEVLLDSCDRHPRSGRTGDRGRRVRRELTGTAASWRSTDCERQADPPTRTAYVATRAGDEPCGAVTGFIQALRQVA